MNNNKLWKKVLTKTMWLDSVLKSPRDEKLFMFMELVNSLRDMVMKRFEMFWQFQILFWKKMIQPTFHKKNHQNVCKRYVVPSQMITSRKPSTNLNKTCLSLLREYFPVSKDGLNQTPRTLNYVNIKTLLYMSYPATFRPISCWLIWKKRLCFSLKADEFLLRYFNEFTYDFISHQIIRIIRYIFCFYTHQKIEALMSKTSLIHILAPLVGWKQQVRHLSKQAWNTQQRRSLSWSRDLGVFNRTLEQGFEISVPRWLNTNDRRYSIRYRNVNIELPVGST